MKHKNGIKIVDPAARTAMTQMRFQIPAQPADEATKKVLTAASLYYDFKQQRAAVADNVDVPHSPSVLTDERYVYKDFRALSASHLSNRGLDFSTPGVLEAAAPLLYGKTVYPNHEFQDINNWVGVVSNSSWDAAGAASNGVPGINCQIKIDAFLNYRIACGVMMSPPAINAMSLTVWFEFEYSHPELEKEGRFWGLLGEEVEGQIVRLIVTKIIEIWEASLVFLGEDRDAKSIDDGSDDEVDFDDESLAATGIPSPNSNEEKTMKLSKEQKTSLGIEFDGEDVPEAELLKAAESLAAKVADQPADLEELKTQAAAGLKLVDEKRAEVLADAKVAELGAEDKDLDPVVAKTIEEADVTRLQELGAYYKKKIGEKFPQGRSSEEDSLEVDTAAGDAKAGKKLPKVSVH